MQEEENKYSYKYETIKDYIIKKKDTYNDKILIELLGNFASGKTTFMNKLEKDLISGGYKVDKTINSFSRGYIAKYKLLLNFIIYSSFKNKILVIIFIMIYFYHFIRRKSIHRIYTLLLIKYIIFTWDMINNSKNDFVISEGIYHILPSLNILKISNFLYKKIIINLNSISNQTNTIYIYCDSTKDQCLTNTIKDMNTNRNKRFPGLTFSQIKSIVYSYESNNQFLIKKMRSKILNYNANVN
ncbi:restriction endonuclease subunit S [Prochlorococcus marinus]|uniref:Deoxynucleoside kinase domain-containing protein n=1 Tax=Prochlorococcus marinus XMU1408 TaxID=2213228 RepID=A0A318R475_PROMR|nr:restriction endonuclease subunit S [Prochlorococcus marinus]MBW3041821.1 hypothetical protein [Prochlorococcus marinus str. XMU1408]PYE02960.1 hypothetical protein DNJ73_04220 [Prochlorococcus marinus XMU1408]